MTAGNPGQSARVAPVVEAMKAEITAFIEAGDIPADVPDFASLHDYIDANMLAFEVYATEAVDGETDDQADARMDEQTPIFNEASTRVDAWLRAGRDETQLSPCCGAFVTYSGDGELYCKKCFGSVG